MNGREVRNLESTLTHAQVIEKLTEHPGKANFTGQTITGSLTNLKLSGTNFTNASLKDVDFAGSKLDEVNFMDADLSGANLESATELIPSQFAGALLTRAKLPKDIAEFPMLEQVREISKNAGALFLTSILASVFVLITVVSTRDIQLLANTGTAQLPFLNVPVGTDVFFAVAPVVLTILFTVLQMYLHRLWQMMATLPAIFPDGATVDQKTYPWLLNDLAALAFPRLQAKRHWISFLFFWFLTFVSYGIVPLTVMATWARALTKHDETLSIFQAIAVAIIGLVALVAFVQRSQCLNSVRQSHYRGWAVKVVALFVYLLYLLPVWLNGGVRDGVPVHPLAEQRSMIDAFSDAGGATEGLTLEARLNKADERLESLLNGDLGEVDQATKDKAMLAMNALVRLRERIKLVRSKRSTSSFLKLLDFQPISPYGDISEDQSRFSKEWKSPKPIKLPSETERVAPAGEDQSLFDQRVAIEALALRRSAALEAMQVPPVYFVRPGQAARTNLRFLNASRSFLVNADFRGSDLTGANFTESVLVGCKWRDGSQKRSVVLAFASLVRANLMGADLSGADLSGADLTGADLSGSDLSGANLTGADLSGVNLIGAECKGAQFAGARFRGARLTGAHLTWIDIKEQVGSTEEVADRDPNASLKSVKFYGADLAESDLSWTNLRYVDLSGLDLSKANLRGANFSHGYGRMVNLSRADLRGAIFNSSDLAHANFEAAFLGDAFLRNAKLSDANLTGAYLYGVDFTDADLSGTNLHGTDFTGANISQVNFDGASITGVGHEEGLNFHGSMVENASFDGAFFLKGFPPKRFPGDWKLTSTSLTSKEGILYGIQLSGNGDTTKMVLRKVE